MDSKGYGSDSCRSRILVVEDDEGLARQFKTRLERAGHDVRVENSGLGALVFAAEHRTDLVLLDLALPDLSGYEVCMELKRIYHPWILPVVMLISPENPKDKLLGFSHGAHASLTKPVKTHELLSMVAEILQDAAYSA